jgi:cysteine desulfurase
MSSPQRIYFDNAATTPLDPRVRAVMRPFQAEQFGNPSSLHLEGRIAREAVERAREQVAALVGAAPEQVVFTSGGTEANNLALTGAVAEGDDGAHIVTTAIEHPAVLETCRALQRGNDLAVTCLGVDGDGCVDPEQLRPALRPQTRLVSVMAANNVTGVIQPVRALSAIVRAHGARFHTDAVQAVGKLPLSLADGDFDLLSLSGHKLHGPKGIGALIVRRRDWLAPILHGGGQEQGLRSGTENVAAIVGLGEAARLTLEERGDESVRLVALRDLLMSRVLASIPGAYLVGHPQRRLPGHLCLGIAGLEGESITLMLALDQAGIAVSTGSACSAHRASEPSYVLRAMGFDALRSRGALRITLGRFNTTDEVEHFLTVLPAIVGQLRPISRRSVSLTGERA